MLESEFLKHKRKNLINIKQNLKNVLESLVNSINYLNDAISNLKNGITVDSQNIDNNKLIKLRDEQITLKNKIINEVLPSINRDIDKFNKSIETAITNESNSNTEE